MTKKQVIRRSERRQTRVALKTNRIVKPRGQKVELVKRPCAKMADADVMETETGMEDQLVEELLQQLNRDNRNTNFMQAFLDKSTSKFDLSWLKCVDEKLPRNILFSLIEKGEFSERILFKKNATNESKRLTSLMQRSIEERKDIGVNSLHIGFPLIECVEENSEKVFLCPLVLWAVKLELSNGRFTLSREFGQEAQVNDTLEKFLRVERDIEFSSKRERMPTHINEVFLERIVSDAVRGLSREDARESIRKVLEGNGLAKVPEAASARGRATMSDRVHWAAILGLFQTANVSVQNDLEAYRTNRAHSIPTNAILGESHLKHSCFALDPSQFAAVEGLSTQKNLVIVGPPGTGKSQTLAGVLSCIGVNGMKALVVCEKPTALDILQKKLRELRWGKWDGGRFSAMISDVQDREEIVTKALLNKSELEQIPLDDCKLQEEKLLTEINRLQKKIDDEAVKFSRQERVIKQAVSFGLTAQEAIAFVVQKKLENHPIFKPKEGVNLKEKIYAMDHLMMLNRCQENMSRDIVDALKMVRIEKMGRSFDSEVLHREADTLIATLEKILEDRAAVIERAKKALVQDTQSKLEAWSNHLATLQKNARDINEMNIKVDDIREFDTAFYLKVWTLFRPTGRQLYSFQSSLNTLKPELEKLCDNKLVKLPTDYSLSQILNIVEWCAKHKANVEERLALLEKESAIKVWLDYATTIPENLKGEFQVCNDRVLEAFGESLFSTKVTLDQIKAVLRKPQVSEKGHFFEMKKILKVFFEEPYLVAWRRAIDSISCLVELGLTEDPSVFHFLLQSGTSLNWGDRLKLSILAQEVEDQCKGLLTSDFVLDQLSDFHTQIKSNLHSLFCVRQLIRMHEAVRKYEMETKQKFEQLFNRATKKVRVNSLREIVKQLDLFTSCFPIMLCTPEVASILFKAQVQYFDLVIVDEASQSLTHDAYAALLKGKKVVIAGDNKQMPPTTLFSSGSASADIIEPQDMGDGDGMDDGDSGVMVLNSKNAANAESLLDFATDHSFAFRVIDLIFHYRSLDPSLMEFHCAAIYPNLVLCPKSASKNRDAAIELVQVNGRYKDQTNRTEAEKIVQLLERVAPECSNANLSLAVATLNDAQRKLILRLIKSHPELQKFLRPSNRFFVKNLENLQGDEVDVLIIGTTFGPTATGSFSQRFGRINLQGLGYRYLNVLFSRAKRKLFIVTSIPESEFLSAERTDDATGCLSGVSMFYGFLAYAKAISDQDESRLIGILKEFSSSSYMSQGINSPSMSCLENVIYKHLISKRGILEEDIQLVPDNNSRTIIRGILVRLNQHRTLVIECNAHESYLKSLHRRDVLNQFNYDYYNIWPANWLFDNPAIEFEKLREVIAKRRRDARPIAAPSMSSQIQRSLSLPTSSVSHEMIEDLTERQRPKRQLVSGEIVAPREVSIELDERQADAASEGVDRSASKTAKRRRVKEHNGTTSANGTPESVKTSGATSSSHDNSAGQNSDDVLVIKLNHPYLVRYGKKRKFIVFFPEKRASKPPLTYIGSCAGRVVRAQPDRIQSLEGTYTKDMFHDSVEYDKWIFHTKKAEKGQSNEHDQPKGSKLLFQDDGQMEIDEGTKKRVHTPRSEKSKNEKRGGSSKSTMVSESLVMVTPEQKRRTSSRQATKKNVSPEVTFSDSEGGKMDEEDEDNFVDAINDNENDEDYSFSDKN